MMVTVAPPMAAQRDSVIPPNCVISGVIAGRFIVDIATINTTYPKEKKNTRILLSVNVKWRADCYYARSYIYLPSLE